MSNTLSILGNTRKSICVPRSSVPEESYIKRLAPFSLERLGHQVLTLGSSTPPPAAGPPFAHAHLT